MRRAFSLVGVAALILALSPSARATSGTWTIATDTTLTEDHFGSIVIAADDVTLDCAGWSIVGSGEPFGVLVEDRDGITLQNCHVTGFSQYGIYVNGSVGSSILDNEATLNGMEDIYGAGYTLTDVQDSVIEGNLAIDNAEPGGAGFEINGASGDQFISNRSIDNRNSSGFYTSDINDSVFVGNTASRNGHGFNMDEPSGSNNTFRNNVASDNTGPGFEAHSTTATLFVGNEVSANGADGFILFDSSANTLSHNDVRMNAGNGVQMVGTAQDNQVEHNSIVGNGEIGLYIHEGITGTLVVNNVLNRNGADGTAVSGVNNTFRGNVMNANGIMGASVGAGSSVADNNVFIGNTANRNAANGLYAADQADGNLFRNNVMTGNVGAGGSVENASFNRFIANRTSRNLIGLESMNGSVGNLFFRNQVTESGWQGIRVAGSFGNTLIHNRVTWSVGEGIALLEGSGNNNVIENVACKNSIDGYDDSTGFGNLWLDNSFCTSNI